MPLHGLQDTAYGSDELIGKIQQTVMLDCRSPLVLQEILTTATNESQSINGIDECFKYWIVNLSPAQPSPQAASDTPQDAKQISWGVHSVHDKCAG